MIKRLIKKLKKEYAQIDSLKYINWLRKQGITIGNNCVFRNPRTVRIDLTRPSLVSIGDNVDMNLNFQILTHDWACSIFRNKYHDFINSSGKVVIGNNIYFGTNVCVLKGVTIGDNCLIGAYSLVTQDIPDNSVAVGVPCKVICSIDEYYDKRKAKALKEAVEYVKSFIIRYGRKPLPSELTEEFIYYIDSENITDYPDAPLQRQLGAAKEEWLRAHHRQFNDYDDFINYCMNTDI